MGLACGAVLARRGHSVTVVERSDRPGTGMSGHNSEVIHSGVYYPEKSRKAEHCMRGRELLLAWCENYRVPYRLVGQLIVANQESDLSQLAALHDRALRNGVEDAEIFDGKTVKKYEPEIRCHQALWLPSTGIFSVADFIKSLEVALQNAGGKVAYHAKVIGVERKHQYSLQIRRPGGGGDRVKADAVINAAGLYADEIAGLLQPSAPREIVFCKGSYFRAPQAHGRIKHLIYPMPHADMAGLGIHLTIDLRGEIRLGPDVEWLTDRVEDYAVDPGREAAFREAVAPFWPLAHETKLVPGFAGIRAKLSRSGFSDFEISDERHADTTAWINLLGMESPGLTASLSIADHIASYDLFS